MLVRGQASPGLAGLQKPYRKMSAILKKQPRDIVLNLCQYGMGDVWQWGKEVGGNSWRTAGDLGRGYFSGQYDLICRDVFDLYANDELHKYGGPGGWNDPDYLLLGYLSHGQRTTRFSPNEQYTHVSLWCLVAAPLIFGGDITRLDDFTLSLLCNDEVIEVDQDPLGKPGRRVAKHGDLEVWARPMEDGSLAVGLFNRNEMAGHGDGQVVRPGPAGQAARPRPLAAEGLGHAGGPVFRAGAAARRGVGPPVAGGEVILPGQNQTNVEHRRTRVSRAGRRRARTDRDAPHEAARAAARRSPTRRRWPRAAGPSIAGRAASAWR